MRNFINLSAAVHDSSVIVRTQKKNSHENNTSVSRNVDTDPLDMNWNWECDGAEHAERGLSSGLPASQTTQQTTSSPVRPSMY